MPFKRAVPLVAAKHRSLGFYPRSHLRLYSHPPSCRCDTRCVTAASHGLSLCPIFFTNDIVQREMPKTAAPHKSRFNDPLKEATIVALKRVVDPLVGLMFDAGVTVREFSQIMRESAVRTAARRVAKETGRNSKSRVAIITGLPRSEVSRILSSNDVSPNKLLGEHPARRVLA